MLQVFLYDDCAVVIPVHGAPPRFDSSLLFDRQFIGLIFQSIKCDAYYDFAGMTYEADSAICTF